MTYTELYKAAVNSTAESGMKSLIAFGNYPASADGKCAPVLWKILDEADGKALMISEMCIDVFPYDDRNDVATWASCSLREYLNSIMINELFSKEEQGLLLEVSNVNADSTYFHAKGGEPSYGGNDTKDKICLLSTEEILKYFGNDGKAGARATEYAKQKLPAGTEWNVPYWLRGPGMRGNLAVYIRTDGTIEYTGYHTGSRDFAIRPVIMVDTSAPDFSTLMQLRLQTEVERPQTVKEEDKRPATKKNGIISIVAGCAGIMLSTLALVFSFLLKSSSLPLYIAFSAAGFVLGLIGFIAGLRRKKISKFGIVLSILAILLGLALLALLFYNRFSYVWDISQYM